MPSILKPEQQRLCAPPCVSRVATTRARLSLRKTTDNETNVPGAIFSGPDQSNIARHAPYLIPGAVFNAHRIN